MSFAAVHIPEFPVSAWQQRAPHLRAKPLVVLEGVPPQEKVASRNQSAATEGIEHGMSKVQAEAMGAVLLRSRDPAEEVAAFAVALQRAERFSPRVQAISSPANAYRNATPSSALLLLDSSGTGTLFGTIENYARQLHAALTAEGFPVGIGAAPNAEAALMLARSGRRIVCADQDNLRGRLAPLPVLLLPCEPRMRALFTRWGIHTLGELAALPEVALTSRLGQAGLQLQQIARGEAGHLLVPEEAPLSLSETTAFDSPIELLDSLLFVISPMLEKVLRKAGEQAYALRSVKLTLVLERAAPHTIDVRPSTPTQNREALLKLLNLQLQAEAPAAGVLSVTLEAEPAQPQTAQRGLFQAQFPDPDKLDRLLARLRAIAGEGNVGSPSLADSHHRDAFTMAPFEPQLLESGPTPESPSRIAIRMLRPPQAVRVNCWDREPRTVLWQGARLSVQACAGPWYSSGSWWDSQVWSCAHWDVVTAEPAQALRLRQDHVSKAWFVVGLYD